MFCYAGYNFFKGEKHDLGVFTKKYFQNEKRYSYITLMTLIQIKDICKEIYCLWQSQVGWFYCRLLEIEDTIKLYPIKECHFHSASHQNGINGYLLYVKRVVILLASANLNLLFTIGLDIFGHIAM